MTTRVKCVIEYDGSNYVGFQIQPNGLSVQQAVEACLADALGHPVRIVASSRTDAGVHARGQVIAFDYHSSVPRERLVRVMNHRLPTDIRMLSCETAAESFHPRYDARAKIYRYLIYRQLEGSVFWHNRSWVYTYQLDMERMQAAASQLVGTHDMSCFCAAGSEVKDRVRTIYTCEWQAEGPLWTLTIEGNGFVYHQVRNMVGTMAEIGRGFWEPDYINSLIASGDRNLAGPTAPAAGLYLEKVIY